MPTYKRMNEKMLHMHSGMFNHKKKSLLFAGTWVTLEDFVLSEISQAQKDKCCVLSFICESYSIYAIQVESKT